MSEIHLIVGLGNPGKKYERTRHNAGFWWVDAIAARKKAAWKKESKFSGHMTMVEEGGHLFRLLKPDTFMNESGRSVAALQRFFHIDPQYLLVVHDELDLPPGTVKMKKGGGTGGHNGPRGHRRPPRHQGLLAPARRHRPPGPQGPRRRLRAPRRAPRGAGAYRSALREKP
jgi:peptidyl-tRNA hydrolase